MPTNQIIDIAADLQPPQFNYSNTFINDLSELNIYKINPTELFYIFVILLILYTLIFTEYIFTSYNTSVQYADNQNQFYYYDSRLNGRYRYTCIGETANGRRCKRRAIYMPTCKYHNNINEAVYID